MTTWVVGGPPRTPPTPRRTIVADRGPRVRETDPSLSSTFLCKISRAVYGSQQGSKTRARRKRDAEMEVAL